MRRIIDLSSLLFNDIGSRTVLALETLSFSMPSVADSDFNGSENFIKLQGCEKKNVLLMKTVFALSLLNLVFFSMAEKRLACQEYCTLL